MQKAGSSGPCVQSGRGCQAGWGRGVAGKALLAHAYSAHTHCGFPCCCNSYQSLQPKPEQTCACALQWRLLPVALVKHQGAVGPTMDVAESPGDWLPTFPGCCAYRFCLAVGTSCWCFEGLFLQQWPCCSQGCIIRGHHGCPAGHRLGCSQ
jgi:hypothetical protein